MSEAQTVSLDETERWIGREHGFAGVDEVSRNDIRRKLEVYCFHCPLHDDDEAARAHGYRGLVAPRTLTPLWAMPAYWTPGGPPAWGPGLAEKPGGVRIEVPNPFAKAVNAASEWEYFEPLYLGDRLCGSWKLIEVKPRQTRLGNGAFLTFETQIHKTTGERVAITRNTLLRYDPAPAAAGAGERPRKPAAEIPADAPPVTAAPVDWSRQLRFGEVMVGDEVPPFGLWLSYQRIVMGVSVDRMFSGIHHNRDQARANGLADIIYNTRGYETMFEVTLRRWIGLDGKLTKLGPFRMGASSHPGDVIVGRGKVTGVEDRGGQGMVKLEIAVANPRGDAATGAAEVALPR
jgi:acyl dehydratase